MRKYPAFQGDSSENQSAQENQPSCSDSCLPRSEATTLSSSMSHLFPISSTWALSHEYVLIWVDLRAVNESLRKSIRTA